MVTSNLKYIMRRQETTVSKLIELSKLSHDTIMRARAAKHIGGCSINTLEKIAKALGCKIKDLFEEEK